MTDSGFDIVDTPDEQQVRSLRNYVFEVPTTDNNWSHCRDNWMRPDAIKWLKEQAALILVRAAMKKHG